MAGSVTTKRHLYWHWHWSSAPGPEPDAELASRGFGRKCHNKWHLYWHWHRNRNRNRNRNQNCNCNWSWHWRVGGSGVEGSPLAGSVTTNGTCPATGSGTGTRAGTRTGTRTGTRSGTGTGNRTGTGIGTGTGTGTGTGESGVREGRGVHLPEVSLQTALVLDMDLELHPPSVTCASKTEGRRSSSSFSVSDGVKEVSIPY